MVSTDPLTKMSTRNISWGVKAAGGSLGSSTSWNPQGLYRDFFTFTFRGKLKYWEESLPQCHFFYSTTHSGPGSNPVLYSEKLATGTGPSALRSLLEYDGVICRKTRHYMRFVTSQSFMQFIIHRYTFVDLV